MFTGIVVAIGRIEVVAPLVGWEGGGVLLSISAAEFDLSDVSAGDSIAVQGVGLTVVDISRDRFDVAVPRDILDSTTGLGAPGFVNLEKALRVHDRLGGHLVSGHVDGLGVVSNFKPVRDSHELRIRAPKAIGKYIATNGSITVNGVSLTVHWCGDDPRGPEFSVYLIPHSLERTTLKTLVKGARVNLEVDLVARYAERAFQSDGANLFIDVEGRVRPLPLAELQELVQHLVDRRIEEQNPSSFQQQSFTGAAAFSLSSGGLSSTRVADVRQRALDVFGDPAKADAWMTRPSVKLGGVRPVDYLDTEDHASAVEGALDALAYGAAL
jgi:riboflavin synthase